MSGTFAFVLLFYHLHLYRLSFDFFQKPFRGRWTGGIRAGLLTDTRIIFVLSKLGIIDCSWKSVRFSRLL